MKSLQSSGGRKHKHISEELRQAILLGKYPKGERLPSEIQLANRFRTSRPTVARALRDLVQQGLIERRAGSGTYVCFPNTQSGYFLGLLIPELGQTEIFEPICQGMAHAREGTRHELVWGNCPPNLPKERQAEKLCEQYIERKVSGVFFAPLQPTEGMHEVNRRIVEALDRAEIPIVLLDRDICGFPRRSCYDLVGIDSRRAGYLITDHLLSLGHRRIVFTFRPESGPTARLVGYREALLSRGITADPEFVQPGDPNDRTFVRRVLERIHPEAFVCVNDITAAQLMRTLDELEVRVPSDVGIVGFDDVKYASLLHVPLTTIHQPCQDLGVAALVAMFERIRHPEMPARDILLDFKLIVRQSCGATLEQEKHSSACAQPKIGSGGNGRLKEVGESIRAR
jgi:DNA-binding LacI/PurR family transcriptional regulator